MRIGWGIAWWLIGIGLLLCSCASVDQFGSRIRDGNLNSQDALNQETLLDIIRARDLQPLNFFAITQVTGGQSEALTTGLPVVTLGQATTALQHQQVITNSLASGVTGGYQGNPLVSTTFQTAMLSAIDLRTIALLVNSHPREPVFHAVLSQIAFREAATNKLFIFFNDPTGDLPQYDCPQLLHDTPVTKLPSLLDKCNYSLFLNYLGVFITGGLTVELTAAAPAPAKPTKPPAGGTGPGGTGPGSGNTGSNPPATIGHLCFNSASAFSNEGTLSPQCAVAKPRATTPATAGALAKAQGLAFAGFGVVEIEFTFRSPLAVFGYLGGILRAHQGNHIDYYTDEARSIIGNEPFLNITDGGPCFTSVLYNGGFYCVPAYSLHTAMLIDILIQLRNLSIQAADLNSAFTVRLTD